MGPEKLDNTVYFIRGLYDLADMAAVQARRRDLRVGDRTWPASCATAFDSTWWYQAASQYADSLDRPRQRAVVPEALDRPDADGGRAARQRRRPCPAWRRSTTATPRWPVGRTTASAAPRRSTRGCSTPAAAAAPNGQGEKVIFGLTTSIQSVGEGNYGRLGAGQQQRYTHALAETMFAEPATGGTPDEQPGAMPEIFPSPDQGANIDRCWTCRSMFMQAWGNYGTAWPVVHQWLGVRPDLGRGAVDVRAAGAAGPDAACGPAIRLGRLGRLARRATHSGTTYTTRVQRRHAGRARWRSGTRCRAGARWRRRRSTASRSQRDDAHDQPRRRGHGRRPGPGKHTLVVTAA